MAVFHFLFGVLLKSQELFVSCSLKTEFTNPLSTQELCLSAVFCKHKEKNRQIVAISALFVCFGYTLFALGLSAL